MKFFFMLGCLFFIYLIIFPFPSCWEGEMPSTIFMAALVDRLKGISELIWCLYFLTYLCLS